MRIPAGEANLLLGADLAVSASDDALAKLNREFSHAVVNSHLAPTAEFTRNADALFPQHEMMQTIRDELSDGHDRFVDAAGLATRLLGDAIFANFFLLGVAYQRGVIPLESESIEHAIEMNGIAVAQNHGAFLWGRRYAVDAESVRRAAGDEHETPQSALDLDALIEDRAARLAGYQNQAYAARYRDLVARVRDRENALAEAGDELPLTAAVAQSYYKLLAYKDEYEVARLFTDGDFHRRLEARFDGDYRLRFHLAPPLLARRDPHSGRPQKREFGEWILPLMRLLARCKGLRGTAFDPFGYTAERRRERAAIAAYEADVETLLGTLEPGRIALATAIAALPQQVRGFGPVKQASAEKAALQRADLLARWNTADPAVALHRP